MLPESIVCWKWKTPGYRSTFGPETVNTLARMVRRNLDSSVRVICVTDDPEGIDPSVEALSLPNDFPAVQSPHGPRWPSCYRRLRAFHPQAATWFGARFVSIDLDVVVTGDLAPVFDRDEDFVGWQDPNRPKQFCGSLFELRAGARPHVWEAFDPKTSPARAAAAGYMGSDQAWISYCLPNDAKWDRSAGVFSFRRDLADGLLPLPTEARLVVFHGAFDPWGREAQRLEWVRENYR